MSFSADFDEQLVELRERNQQMDAMCSDADRDPATLRRTVNLFDGEARQAGGRIRYYDDPSLLERLVAELTGAGYTEIGLYYPSDPAQLDTFEAIARDVVPAMRQD